MLKGEKMGAKFVIMLAMAIMSFSGVCEELSDDIEINKNDEVTLLDFYSVCLDDFAQTVDFFSLAFHGFPQRQQFLVFLLSVTGACGMHAFFDAALCDEFLL